MNRNRFLAVIFTVTVALSGIAVAGADEKDKTDPVADKTFQSVEKHEVGISPNGVAKGYWSISFKDGKFSWRHSDVVESGTYEYDAKTGVITGKPAGGKLTYQGTIDAKSGELTWEKVKYKEKK